MKKIILYALICLVAHDAHSYHQLSPDLFNAVKPTLKEHARRGVDSELGILSGIFDLKALDYNDPLLISSTDGVGSKLVLAQMLNNHKSIGIDLVASCVNNLVAQGAEPLFFLTYYAMEKLNIAQGTELITSIAAGCKQSNCMLIGGESAEIPGIYKNNQYDLVGFIVGAVERDQLLPKTELINADDVIIGIASNGLHTHGFSHVRKILEQRSIDIAAPAPFATTAPNFGTALLAPTIIYANAVLPLCKENKIKAIAHIANGGLEDNLARIIPAHLSAKLSLEQWYVHPIFRWIKAVTGSDDQEMFKAFNMGIGMALIVAPEDSTRVIRRLQKEGHRAYAIGKLSYVDGTPVQISGKIKSHLARVMIIGGGAREHALAWKLAQSPFVELVCVSPGNAGTSKEKKILNVPIQHNHVGALITYAKQNYIDLTIVNPETPQANNIVDEFTKAGLRCLGPTKQAAHIESSKAFAKDFMKRNNIPTPMYEIFTTYEDAEKYIHRCRLPLVIKADGLAPARGVTIAETHDDALAAAQKIFQSKAAPNNPKKVIVEQFITGQEVSFMVITDGTHCLPFATAQKNSARDNGDKGLRTEGMGACSPAPIINDALHARIMKEIINPAIQGMKAEGRSFAGFLYAGIIIDRNNNPYVLEFNCKLSDPEAGAIMIRLTSDLYTLCNAALEKELDSYTLTYDERPSISVVLAASGYPQEYKKGEVITGLPKTEKPHEKIFHAATRFENGNMVTDGGRVLCVTALGKTFDAARNNTYKLAEQISWPDKYCRKDIGFKAIAFRRS